MNVSGGGLLSQRPEARRFAEFLLSVEGQRFFATDTAEYPLVEGVHPDGVAPDALGRLQVGGGGGPGTSR